MKALVTGDAGFIGSHIVERLLKDGHSVVVLDNFSTGKEENLSIVSDLLSANRYPLNAETSTNRYTLIRGDIRSYEACLKACSGVDVVFHQAALRSVPKLMKTSHDYNDVSIDGTLTLLEAARECKVKRFVFASSSSVYGDPDTFPEREDFYPMLIFPYALLKLAGEYYCRIFNENFGVEYVSLRYFNVYGPRQALDDEYAVVAPKFINCILNDEPPPIFGNGKQSRDFVYIDNVVEANIFAATVPLCDTRYEIRDTNANRYPLVFNIANGQDNTVLGLVEVLNKIMGKNIKPEFLDPRPGDVFKTHADISRAKQFLGYKPKVGFEEVLRRTVEYWKNQRIVNRV